MEGFDVDVRWVQVVMEQILEGDYWIDAEEIACMHRGTWEIRCVRMRHTYVHTFREKKKKKKARVISFQMSPSLLVKTSLFDLPVLHPALCHSKEDRHSVEYSWTSKFQGYKDKNIWEQ